MAEDSFKIPEDADVVVITAATLRKAEKVITSCEHCNPSALMIPFGWIVEIDPTKLVTVSMLLDIITEEEWNLEGRFQTSYIFEEPASCPSCHREVLQNTWIEPEWFRDLQKRADQGDSEAQVNLGRMYEEGVRRSTEPRGRCEMVSQSRRPR